MMRWKRLPIAAAGATLIFLYAVGLMTLSWRASFVFWLASSIAVFAFCALRGRRLLRCSLAILLTGALLSMSPVDFTLRHRSDGPAVRFMPVGYGYVAPEGTVSYGCIPQKHGPKWAIVVCYGFRRSSGSTSNGEPV